MGRQGEAASGLTGGRLLVGRKVEVLDHFPPSPQLQVHLLMYRDGAPQWYGSHHHSQMELSLGMN